MGAAAGTASAGAAAGCSILGRRRQGGRREDRRGSGRSPGEEGSRSLGEDRRMAGGLVVREGELQVRCV